MAKAMTHERRGEGSPLRQAASLEETSYCNEGRISPDGNDNTTSRKRTKSPEFENTAIPEKTKNKQKAIILKYGLGEKTGT